MNSRKEAINYIKDEWGIEAAEGMLTIASIMPDDPDGVWAMCQDQGWDIDFDTISDAMGLTESVAKFNKFLHELKNDDNKSLIESITKGFNACLLK